MDIEPHRAGLLVIERLHSLLVAGQPVVGLVMAEDAAGPADERIVVSIFIWMQAGNAADAGEQDRNSKSGAEGRLAEQAEQELETDGSDHKHGRQDEEKMPHAIVH